MATAAERAAAKAARLADKGAGSRIVNQTPEVAAPASVTESRAGRVKPVRTTLDLAPALYDSFDDWARTAERELREYGIGRQIKAETQRALLRRFLDDPALQREVVEQLKREAKR